MLAFLSISEYRHNVASDAGGEQEPVDSENGRVDSLSSVTVSPNSSSHCLVVVFSQTVQLFLLVSIALLGFSSLFVVFTPSFITLCLMVRILLGAGFHVFTLLAFVSSQLCPIYFGHQRESNLSSFSCRDFFPPKV